MTLIVLNYKKENGGIVGTTHHSEIYKTMNDAIEKRKELKHAVIKKVKIGGKNENRRQKN